MTTLAERPSVLLRAYLSLLKLICFPVSGLPVNPKGNQPWLFIGRPDTEAEAPILWPPDAKSWLTGKHPAWCWERLRARGERSDRGWDGWMASLAQWTWVWANSGRCWRTGNTSVLQYLGSLRVRHDWATEQQQQSDLLALLPFFPIQIVHNSRILMPP